jgi:hypothetical protein
MATGRDLAQEGIAAYKAGEKGRAQELLSQAVKDNPNHEQAWYFLAAVQTDMTRRKECLEMVIKINPGNTRAHEMLAKTNARLAESGPTPPPPQAQTFTAESPKVKQGIPVTGEGFTLPFEIPGAPTHITPRELVDSGISLLRNSVGIFLKQPGAYEDEIRRATWWRFWLMVGTGSVVSAILYAIGNLFLEFRFPPANILSPILTLIFSIPINMAAVYVGCYVSHWYATKQAHGLASQVEHSHAMAAAWMPGNIASAALGAIVALLFGSAFSFAILMNPSVWGFLGIGLLLLIIVSIALALYTLSIQVKGVQILYKFVGGPLWITTALMLVVTGITYGILDSILPG